MLFLVVSSYHLTKYHINLLYVLGYQLFFYRLKKKFFSSKLETIKVKVK